MELKVQQRPGRAGYGVATEMDLSKFRNFRAALLFGFAIMGASLAACAHVTASQCVPITPENKEKAERLIRAYITEKEIAGAAAGFFELMYIEDSKQCGPRLIITYFPREGVNGSAERYFVNLENGRVMRRFIDH